MIFVIGGVTGSGKTKLAFKFAKKVNGVLINADAFAVYKELVIGTAKPTKNALSEVTNHMFNIVSVVDQFSIYNYQLMVRALIEEYQVTNKPIILVGGSGLYIRSVLYDYTFSEDKTLDSKKYENKTNEELHKLLSKRDKESAEKIHVNNRKRVVRALVIYDENKVSKTTIEKRQIKTPLYPYILVNLDLEKEKLDEGLRLRVSNMFKDGLRSEVNQLVNDFPKDLQALQAIGYKEIILNNQEDDYTLINLITLRTRQYAKRQRTYFKNQLQGVWFNDQTLAFDYLIKKYEETKHEEN